MEDITTEDIELYLEQSDQWERDRAKDDRDGKAWGHNSGGTVWVGFGSMEIVCSRIASDEDRPESDVREDILALRDDDPDPPGTIHPDRHPAEREQTMTQRSQHCGNCGKPLPSRFEMMRAKDTNEYPMIIACPCGKIYRCDDSTQQWKGDGTAPTEAVVEYAHEVPWLGPDECECPDCVDFAAQKTEKRTTGEDCILKPGDDGYEEASESIQVSDPYQTDGPDPDVMMYLRERYDKEPVFADRDSRYGVNLPLMDLEFKHFYEGWGYLVIVDSVVNHFPRIFVGDYDTLADACDAADEAVRELCRETLEKVGGDQ